MWLAIELNTAGFFRPRVNAPCPPIETPLIPRWSRSAIVR